MPDEPLPPGKVPVWRISLTRLRSPLTGPGLFTATAADPPGCWDRANAELADWARGAPDGEGEFEPIRYEISFFDNQAIVGQVSLQRRNRAGYDLAQVILLGLHVYVGTFKPANFTWSEYRAFLEAEGERGRKAAAILDGYDFGAEFERPVSDQDWDSYEGTGTLRKPDRAPELARGILSYIEGRH